MDTIKNLRGDLFGGVTAAVVALPLALAFGVASGAGPLAGLYGAIIAGFFAAVFGGTKTQITGPTGPMTVVMALVVTHFSGNPSAAFAVVVLAGIFQIVFGVIAVGQYVKLTPQPVVSGFMSGIGMIIIIVQIGPLLGHADPPGSILLKLAAIPKMLESVNLIELSLGLLTLGIVFFAPARLTRFIPSPLIALLIGSGVAAIFHLDVAVIGEVPAGLPNFSLPVITLAEVPYIVQLSLILAFLGSIDSLLTSIVVDSLTRTHHDSNRELFGQGVGNIVSGLFGAIPSAGATMRSVVNVRAGGRSQLSGVVHSGLLLFIVLGFGSIVKLIPLTVLAGILLKVGIDIIDWRSLGRIRRAPRAGVIIMLSTLLLTIFVNLITAVAAGFVMASILFVASAAQAQISNAKFALRADQIEDLSPEEAAILNASDGRIVLFHVEGPLSFGSARDIARLMQSDIEKDVLAIDMRHVPFIDSSAALALEEVIQRLHSDDDEVILFGVREQVLNTLRQTDVLKLLGANGLFNSRKEALVYAYALIQIANGKLPAQVSQPD